MPTIPKPPAFHDSLLPWAQDLVRELEAHLARIESTAAMGAAFLNFQLASPAAATYHVSRLNRRARVASVDVWPVGASPSVDLDVQVGSASVFSAPRTVTGQASLTPDLDAVGEQGDWVSVVLSNVANVDYIAVSIVMERDDG